MTKPEDIAAEKAVFAFEARIQGGEFEGLDPNGTDARDALKAEIRKAILSAVEEERERNAVIAETISIDPPANLENDPNGFYDAGMLDACFAIAAAIRNRKES